jgi:hypothetical protein
VVGIGVVACADLLRVSERTIRGWESGATRIPYAAYKLLRLLKGGKVLGPAWRDFFIRGNVLVTPEGHRFEAGELGWLSLLVLRARAFTDRRHDRITASGDGLPARPTDSATAPALGLVSYSTSETRTHLESSKQGVPGQLVGAGGERPGQGFTPQQVPAARLARVLQAAGGAP